MRLRVHLLAASAAVLLFAAIAIAQSQSQGDYSDLIGKQVDYGDKALRDRGFRLVESSEGDDRGQKATYAYWWHEGNKECISTAVKGGIYSSIMSARATRCKTETAPSPARSTALESPVRNKAGYADLIGKEAGLGDNELTQRGYTLIQTSDAKDEFLNKITIAQWWHAGNKECIAATLKKGVYTAIKPIDAAGCKPRDDAKPDERTALPSAVRDKAVYADLIGKEVSFGDKRLKERGYTLVNKSDATDEFLDKITTAQWWHDGNKECIAATLKRGVYTAIKPIDAAGCKPRDDARVTGTVQEGDDRRPVPAGLEDLIDLSAPTAEQKLKSRGFRQVAFDEKNQAADLAWFYNDQTRACIRVKIKNGQYKNIVSDNNPNCR
jgi:hypothetical protein